MMDAATIKRFEVALASDRLKALAKELSTEGLSQAAVCHQFELFWRFVDEAGRTKDEAELYSALECIIGYCSPGSKWFDHYLTNEEIYEYRRSLAEQNAPGNAG